MRAKIASRANGHALEERFLQLRTEQLLLLYHQALKEEEAEQKEKLNWIRLVNDAWVNNFTNVVEQIQMFINPKMFERMKDMQKLNVYREEITEDNFVTEWKKILDVIPNQYFVEEVVAPTESIVAENDPLGEVIAGWVPYSQRRKWKGDVDQNE